MYLPRGRLAASAEQGTEVLLRRGSITSDRVGWPIFKSSHGDAFFLHNIADRHCGKN